MKCNHCGHEIRKGLKFCEMCGTEVKFFCPACGMENDPSVNYCMYCGAVLHANINRRPEKRYYGGERLGEITGLRGTLASPLMLVCIIFLTLSCFFSLFGRSGLLASILESDLYYSVSMLAYYGGLDEFSTLEDMLYDAAYAEGAIRLFGQWPLIVVIVGLWMSWIGARKSAVDPMKEGGLKAIRFVAVFFLVVYIVAVAVFVVAMIYAMISLANNWFSDMAGVCAVVLVVGLLVLAAVCLFFKMAGAALTSVREGLRVRSESCEISRFFVFMVYFIGTVAAVGTVIGIQNSNGAGFFAGTCKAAGLIICGVLLGKCRSSDRV